MRHRPPFRVAVIAAAIAALASPGIALAAPSPTAKSAGPSGTSAASPCTLTSTAPCGNAAPPQGSKPAGGPSRAVTLITGDTVDVYPDGSAQVSTVPGQTRKKMQFVSRTVQGDREIIPVDALPLVASGKLDERLFDVTLLVKQQYDNDVTSNLPLILTYPTPAAVPARTSDSVATMAVTRRVPAAKMVAVREHHSSATATWSRLTTRGAHGQRALADGIGKIWLDAKGKVSLDQSVPQIGAPIAWAAGETGAGITVGLIDSGVDDTHPDLAGKVVDRQDFTTEADNLDHAGHGTHVASTILGTGAASDGKYKGVAPDARLYSAKVCIADGTCADSAIIAGMTWIAQKGVRVANMSLGGPDAPGVDPMEQTLEDLTAQYGTLFVVASGNDGGWTSSPASAPDALAVGAVDKQDQLASWSNRGIDPSELAVKPELVAPGVNITAARSKDSPGDPGEMYVSKSGTSMATPHVTGSVALLAEQHPDWTHDQLKDALVSTAKDTGGSWFTEGAGRVDVGRAVTQPVYASPSTLSFGDLPAPHDASQKAGKVVTYHNNGSAPVTLDLTMAATAADGSALPAGAFTVSPASVTIPAGGTAPVTVTSDPTVGSPTGEFLGAVLTAKAATGDVTVRTAMTVALEPQLYTLTVTSLDRDGNPTGSAYGWLYDESTGSGRASVWDSSGTAKVQVRAGTYTLDTLVYSGSTTTLLVYPVVVMDHDQSITLDARLGKPMSVTTPRPDATLVEAHVGFTMGTATGWYLGDILISDSFDGMYTAQVGPDDPAGNILGDASALFAKVGADGTPNDSPYLYNLAWYAPKGSFFTGFDKTFAARDLATVHNTYDAPQAGTVAETIAQYKPSWDHAHGFGGGTTVTLPMARTEYFSTGGGMMWDSTLNTSHINADGSQSLLVSHHEPFAVLKPGQQLNRVWNQGVFGPGFRTDPPNDPQVAAKGIYRTGDTLWLLPSLFTDSASRNGSVTGSGSSADHITLTSGGTTLVDNAGASAAAVSVPAGKATYTLSITQDRSAALPDLPSNVVSASWTFSSGHVDGTRNLDVSAFRFTPILDQNNASTANAVIPVPFTVQHQPGSTASVTTTSDVQVSYDDGKTWVKPVALRGGDQGLALVKNPASGYVSLKATATDAAGDSVTETIIHAYRVA